MAGKERPLLLLLALAASLGVRAAPVVFQGSEPSSSLSAGFIRYPDLGGKPFRVSYDKRALLLDGTPALFLSGSIHPPRSTVAMWDSALDLAVASGLNMVEVYVFWVRPHLEMPSPTH